MVSDFYEDEKIRPEDDIGSRMAFGKLMPLLRPHRSGLLLCLALLLSATILSLIWPVLMKRALDIDIKNGDFNGLLLTVAAIGMIQAFTLAFQYIQRIKLEMIGRDVMVDLKQTLFYHILSPDVSFFDRNPVGRLMARIESDTESLRMLFTNTVVLVVGDLFLVVGIFGLMFYFSWRLAAILLTIMPIIIVLVIIFERITTPRFLAVRMKMAEVTAQLTEFLHGMSIIQIFHRGSYARSRVYRAKSLSSMRTSM